MRTLVTFKSDVFNTSEPKDYFINPGCFGDDLANWLMNELQKHSIEIVVGPQQEDFGWYFTFRVSKTAYDFIISFRSGDPIAVGDWIGHLERKWGFIGSMLGWRNRGIQRNATYEIHRILSESPCIRDVHWHYLSKYDKDS